MSNTCDPACAGPQSDGPGCAPHGCLLSAYMASRGVLQLHTGNIIKWPELKTKGFTNSAQELVECMRLQMKRWKPAVGSENGPRDTDSITLCDNPQCKPSLEDHLRADLKITLKIFLANLDEAETRIDQCLDTACRELGVQSVEQLIVALPEFDPAEHTNDDAAMSEAAEAAAWLERVKPIWRHVETLVARDEKAVAAGFADLEAAELKALYEWAEDVKPAINHYNIEGCCAVPDELRAFARDHDILLLTHNDPRDFPGSKRLASIGDVDPSLRECCSALSRWRTAFVARYTVMIRSRAIVTSKGFIVRFEKGKEV